MSSVFGDMSLDTITLEQATELLRLPRILGEHPDDGEAILANNGRYGPYLQKGRDYRSLDSEHRLLTITLEEALTIYSQPKVYKGGARRGGRGQGSEPVRQFGTDPASERPVVAKEGPLRRVRHRR